MDGPPCTPCISTHAVPCTHRGEQAHGVATAMDKLGPEAGRTRVLTAPPTGGTAKHACTTTCGKRGAACVRPRCIVMHAMPAQHATVKAHGSRRTLLLLLGSI